MKYKIKTWIAIAAWHTFLWAIQMTKDEYWSRVHYELEKKRIFDETPNVERPNARKSNIPEWPIKGDN